MSIGIQLARIQVPELEFAGPGYFSDPRKGMADAGPLDLRYGAAHKLQIRLAIVGPSELLDTALNWFARTKAPISSIEKPMDTFPGFDAVFRSELVADRSLTLSLDQAKLDAALAKTPY